MTALSHSPDTACDAGTLTVHLADSAPHVDSLLPQQLLDLRSFPDRSLLRRYASIWATDNYARKAWRMILRRHRPDAVFFLGDLLDSGVEVTDRDEWVCMSLHLACTCRPGLS